MSSDGDVDSDDNMDNEATINEIELRKLSLFDSTFAKEEMIYDQNSNFDDKVNCVYSIFQISLFNLFFY